MKRKADKSWTWRETTRHLARLTGARRVATFALLFLVLFGSFHVLYETARGTAVERLLIDDFTVKPSVALINLLTPAESVTAKGHRLVSPSARLSVLNSCEGFETMLLLIAAVAAYAARWRAKAIGLLLGMLLIYALNQVRIVSLYYAFRYDRELFHALHGYLAPMLIIAAAGLYFLWWVSREQRLLDATASA